MLELSEGLDMVSIAMGLFGISEILLGLMRSQANPYSVQRIKLRSLIPTRQDIKDSISPTLRGSGLGTIFGILPGAGPTIASFIAYAVERRVSRTPEKFGKGAIEGVASPEAANNAAVQAAFIPTLSLGIPGDATSAILLGALMIHGIAAGPGLVSGHPELFWGLIASFWVGNVLLVLLNIPLIGVWVSVLRIPYRIMYPAMLFFICIGVYSIRMNTFDVFVAIGFGLLGVLLHLGRFPAAPLLLGFILGPMVEDNLRNALLISRGNPNILFGSWISTTFMLATIAMLLWPLVGALLTRRAARPAGAESLGSMRQ
jgi:TctA family transporter